MNESDKNRIISAKRYKEIIDLANEIDTIVQKFKEYEEIGSDYNLAVCPFCKAVYCEFINNYNIEHFPHWRFHGQSLSGIDIVPPPCEHYLVVDRFINFNGHVLEINKYELTSRTQYHCEKPHVMGCFFREPYFDCKAVIHSLPIYKIVEDHFEPRYKAYIITYYSPVNKKEDNMRRLISCDYEGSYFGPPKEDEPNPDSWWDLKKWVKEDKLYWIDPTKKEFTLVKGNVDKFPYGDIKGRVEPYWDEMPPNPYKNW